MDVEVRGAAQGLALLLERSGAEFAEPTATTITIAKHIRAA
jgi:hypothetical protein